MRLLLMAPLLLGLLGPVPVPSQELSTADRLSWSELTPLPDTPGLGGPFVGAHGGRLFVAGGANFPDAVPWEGGTKVWYSGIHVLGPGEDAWRDGGQLEGPLAYGAAVSLPDGIAILGGSDSERHHAECWLLSWDGESGGVRRTALPSLPVPTAFPAAAALGSVIYLAAGSAGTDPTALTHAFWALDLSRPEAERRWEEQPPWPGPARHKAVAAVQSGGGTTSYFHLFSGEIPSRNGEGELDYEYRTDAYRFDPRTAIWERLSDLPNPVAAASAVPIGQSQVLVFSGSTGAHVKDPDPRPEFPRVVLSYHTITDTWTVAGGMPQAVVTSGVAEWQGRIVIASGEVRPGMRTPAVRAVQLAPQKAGFGLLNTIVLAVYLLTLVGIGVYFARRETSTGDFFLAGQRIPWWAAGISILATQLSAITFVSIPAVAYATDWVVLPAQATILLMAPVVVFLYLPFFCRLNITTAYEYLERRFNVTVRLFGSASFIAFQLMRMAIVIFLPSLALSTITGIDVYACILIMGVLSTLYTTLGGMEAVVWTDVLQSVVLYGGLLIAMVVVAGEMGGFGAVLDVAVASDKMRILDPSFSFTELATWSILLGAFALNFGPYTTDQSVVQRYLTTKDEKAAARGVWLNGLLAIPSGLLFMAMGTCLYVFFEAHPDLLPLGMQNDEVLPLFVSSQLPAGLSGLVIAGVFAASMSSLDSSMHSIATAATIDWYKRFSPTASDRSCLRLARGLTVLLGFVAVATAFVLVTYDIRSLWFFFQKCLGLLSSGVVGVFILGIFTRRATATGSLVGAAAATGILVYVIWFTPLHFFLYPVVGITTCVVVGYLASRVLPKGPPRDLTGLTRAGGLFLLVASTATAGAARADAASPMEIVSVTTEQSVTPALVGEGENPVARVRIETTGSAGPMVVTELRVHLRGTTALADIESVEILGEDGARLGQAQAPAQELTFQGELPLREGTNDLRLSVSLAPTADLDHVVDAGCDLVLFSSGLEVEPEVTSPPGAQRLALALRAAGDDGAAVYRIPGLATTRKGTLLAVYDVRWNGWKDLPGDVDVGLSRSVDGGRSWKPMKIILDMGKDPAFRFDGVGDPAILIDRETGTAWVAALWSHGDRGWHGSGPGLSPDETGQIVLVKSDDDGRTWSAPINITEQVKHPEWSLALAGPGRGISMKDGTLVFAAQYLDTPEKGRTPRSTLLYSRDHGETWHLGTGARTRTTEAQVVELEEGVLMLNMRDDRGGFRAVSTTGDLGKTWQEHPTSRKALVEPVCNASLIHAGGRALLFANPAVSEDPRRRMTLKASPDFGATWPETSQLLLDEGQSAGYPSLTMIDEETVGLLFEGSRAHLTFMRIRLDDLLR